MLLHQALVDALASAAGAAAAAYSTAIVVTSVSSPRADSIHIILTH